MTWPGIVPQSLRPFVNSWTIMPMGCEKSVLRTNNYSIIFSLYSLLKSKGLGLYCHQIRVDRNRLVIFQFDSFMIFSLEGNIIFPAISDAPFHKFFFKKWQKKTTWCVIPWWLSWWVKMTTANITFLKIIFRWPPYLLKRKLKN